MTPLRRLASITPFFLAPPVRGVLLGAATCVAVAGALSTHAAAQPSLAALGCDTTHTADSDRDGIPQSCELAVATRYAPLLHVRSGGCNWDVERRRLAGGYFFAVQPADTVVRIAYLPAWFRDCGWSGSKCLLPGVDCAPHAGDSEIIVVELSGDADTAYVSGVFLSAHCFGRSGGDCRWYRGRDLARFEWRGPAPVVWVAEGRQANYPSRDACDAGHYSIDTCDHHDAQYVFPVKPWRDLGSRRFPVSDDGCVTGAELVRPKAPADAVECFWSETPFRGWQEQGPGSTPYARYLLDVVLGPARTDL